MNLTYEESQFLGVLAKRISKRAMEAERKIARENDMKKIQLDFEGLNFIKFLNYIHFGSAEKRNSKGRRSEERRANERRANDRRSNDRRSMDRRRSDDRRLSTGQEGGFPQ